ncbi:hypothetical protein [Salinibacillus xinjiangensis]|uniref:Uncharacterized protein n=1 Tax=Salinibacillus xinjiangensis TaxID=1229268 RepID=A0A6G1X791_9BACI|nr:hypothetical protein [Salinibacillus xinjiangensis]MRG86775.1 hypothetical protein [Salinibacillus xinjiangensis]
MQAPIRLFGSLLFILFFSYQLFTPYFYSDNSLEKSGVEHIKSYYKLSDDNLTAEQRENLAKSSLNEEMAYSALKLGNYPESKLTGIDVLEINRNYYLYHLIVEVKEQVDHQIEKMTYRFTFDKENGGFKINGMEVVNH